MSNKTAISLYYTFALFLGLTGYYFSTTTFIYKIGPAIFFFFIEIAYVMMVIKIFALDSSIDEIAWFILFSMLLVIPAKNSGDTRLLFLVAFVLASKNIEFESILKTYIITISTELVFTIICALLGKISNLSYLNHGGGSSIALGSVYTTNFCAHIFYLVLAYVILKKFNISLTAKIFIGFVGVFVLFYESVRLDGILIFAILLLTIFPSMVSISSKIRNIWLLCIESVIMVITIVLSYIYSPTKNWMIFLDKLLSNRLFEGWQAFNLYTPTLFGQRIKMQGMGGESGTNIFLNNYFYIDSSYVQILFISGILSFIIVFVLILIHSYRLQKRNNILIVSLLLVLVSSMIDDLLLNMSYNIFLLSLLAKNEYFDKKPLLIKSKSLREK